jgi:hypothetical protein
MLEAEIWMIRVPGQPGQKNLQDPISTENSLASWFTPVTLAGNIN